MARRIGVVTGTRAEYGHLYWVLRALADDPRCDVHLYVTGAHLSKAHGMTIDTIESQGITLTPVDIELTDDTNLGIAKAIGLGTRKLAEAFERTRPDVIVILGDRYELLCAAEAALVMKIPVAHIHGGELTQGAFDDAIRHALTKMSHLHFASADAYAKRIRQLGEDPATIFSFGAPGLDHLSKTARMSLDELGADIGFPLVPPFLLVTFHPETLASQSPDVQAEALTDALDEFVGETTILFTGVNADPGHRSVAERIEAFIKNNPGRATAVQSLGQRRYLSAMHLCAAVVGNSSSGLIEAPALGRPTVNIGDRQQGRLRSASVIDCAAEADAIVGAIRQALSPAFQKIAAEAEPPLGRGGASDKIAAVIASHPLENLTKKSFHDIEFPWPT